MTTPRQPYDFETAQRIMLAGARVRDGSTPVTQEVIRHLGRLLGEVGNRAKVGPMREPDPLTFTDALAATEAVEQAARTPRPDLSAEASVTREYPPGLPARAVDLAVAAVFEQFPGTSWIRASLREIVGTVLGFTMNTEPDVKVGDWVRYYDPGHQPQEGYEDHWGPRMERDYLVVDERFDELAGERVFEMRVSRASRGWAATDCWFAPARRLRVTYRATYTQVLGTEADTKAG